MEWTSFWDRGAPIAWLPRLPWFKGRAEQVRDR